MAKTVRSASTGRIRLHRWLDERLGISAFSYPVPRHANTLAYTLGGITMGSFLLLVATGVYLTQFYEPTPAAAHRSVVELTQGDIGSIIRGLHFWLSSIFIATLVLHLMRTFVTGSFKRPREATWISGVLLFIVGGGLLFTGTILKWDQEAIEALAHNSEIADLFGAAGFWFSEGFSQSVPLLLRDYIAHVSILPVVAVFLLAAHMFLIKRHGVSSLPWGDAHQIRVRAQHEQHHPFTTHLGRILYWTLLVLGVAFVLAVVRPAGIGPEAVEGIEITKPPWYFLWLYPFENWFGVKALAVVPGVLLAGLVALPFLDRGEERDPRRRKVWIAAAATVVLAWVALTIYGYVTEPVAHVGK